MNIPRPEDCCCKSL